MDSSEERPNKDIPPFSPHNDVSEGEENPIDVQESQMLESLISSSTINRRPSLIQRNGYSAFTKFDFNFESIPQMEDLYVGQSRLFKYNGSQMVYCPTNLNVENYPGMPMRRTVARNVVAREYMMKELFYGFRSIQRFQREPFILMTGSYITPLLQHPYSINRFGKEVNVVELYSPSPKWLSTITSKRICEQYTSWNNFNMSMNLLSDFNNSFRNSSFYSSQLPHFIPIIQRNQLVEYQMVTCRPISMIGMYIQNFLFPQTTD